MTETEAQAIGMEIDHYLPRNPDGGRPDLEHEYSNLCWSCSACNVRKSDYLPTDIDAKNGYVVLRPDEHDFADHIELHGERLRGLSRTGEFTIMRLDLNRLNLVRLRQIRRTIAECDDFIANGIRDLTQHRLDDFKQTHRGLIDRARRRMEELRNSLNDDVAAWLVAYARSPMLEPDPDKASRAKTRRAFLKEAKAVGVARVWAASARLQRDKKKRGA